MSDFLYVCAVASQRLGSREGFEKRRHIFVCVSQGKNAELGSREISVRKFTCDRISRPHRGSKGIFMFFQQEKLQFRGRGGRARRRSPEVTESLAHVRDPKDGDREADSGTQCKNRRSSRRLENRTERRSRKFYFIKLSVTESQKITPPAKTHPPDDSRVRNRYRPLSPILRACLLQLFFPCP